jgi:hypothetical protein
VNGSSSGGFSFEVGFWFDKDDRAASQGSPRFTSAIITNVAGGSTFSQNLGGLSVNPGGTVSLAFVEDAASLFGAPVTVDGLKPGGVFQGGTAVNWLDGGLEYTGGDLVSLSGQVMTIPGTVSQAIADFTTRSLKVKLRLEESVGGTARGYLTRTIGFDFANSSNNPPSITLESGGTPIAAGDIVEVAIGSTVTLTATATDADAENAVNLAFTSLPAWAVAGTSSGTNPTTRTLTLSPTAGNATVGDRNFEITAVDDDSFALTTSFSFVVRVSGEAPNPGPDPAPAGPAPSPVSEPGGGLPVVPPGGSSGSVGGVPQAPVPSVPTSGAAQFTLGPVQATFDLSGAGGVSGPAGSPTLSATRDRVATLTGGGMQAGTIAEVWLPLPGGGSRQVALLPIGPDGRFDGALPFTGELDGQGPLPIGDRTLQLFGVNADGQLTVINVGIRILQPGPNAPEPDRGQGAPPALAPGQSLATNAGLPTPVTITPIPGTKTLLVEGDGWLLDIAVPDGTLRDEAGNPIMEIVLGDRTIVAGNGFLPGTRAYVWLMSDPRFLGEVTINPDGTFRGSLPVTGVTPGPHTLQVSGVGTDGYIRAANLGVIVTGTGTGARIPTRVNTGGGPVPTLPLPLGVTIALAGVLLTLLQQQRTLAWITGTTQQQRTRARTAPGRRLTAFDQLQARLDQTRSTVR